MPAEITVQRADGSKVSYSWHSQAECLLRVGEIGDGAGLVIFVHRVATARSYASFLNTYGVITGVPASIDELQPLLEGLASSTVQAVVVACTAIRPEGWQVPKNVDFLHGEPTPYSTDESFSAHMNQREFRVRRVGNWFRDPSPYGAADRP